MDDKDYRDLGRGGLARDFALTRRDQGDYDARRREWLDFITTYGREASPHYRPRGSGGEWVHEILQAPPAQPAAYNVVGGPFYRGAPGTADRQPDRVEWTPFAVGQSLPQQIVWANRGLDLLNSGSVTRDLQAYETDSDSDKPVPPPPTESVQVVIADLTAPPLAEDYE